MCYPCHGPSHLPVQSQPSHAMERLGGLHPEEPRNTPFSSGTEVRTPPGSSIVSVEPDYGPFSVTLVMEDGHILVQPTWPTINVQLLRRQVATSLACSPVALYFVCHGSILGLERRLSDHPVITSTTRILLFFSLTRALESLGICQDTPAPPTPPPPAPPTPRAPRPSFGPEPPPGFSRPQASPAPPPSTPRGGSSDKLRSTFKCPKFLGDTRHWKQWDKGFIRFLAIQLLDYVIAVGFKPVTPAAEEDNKLVYYVLEDAVSGSPVAAKYIRRALI
jgi:hypothetical protein